MRRRANPWHLAAPPTSHVRIVAFEAEGDRAGELAAAAAAFIEPSHDADYGRGLSLTHVGFTPRADPPMTTCRLTAYRRRVAATIEDWDALPGGDLRCDDCDAEARRAR